MQHKLKTCDKFTSGSGFSAIMNSWNVIHTMWKLHLTVNVVSGWEGAAVCGCYNPGDVFFLYKVRSETQTTANARLGLKIRQTKIFL